MKERENLDGPTPWPSSAKVAAAEKILGPDLVGGSWSPAPPRCETHQPPCQGAWIPGRARTGRVTAHPAPLGLRFLLRGGATIPASQLAVEVRRANRSPQSLGQVTGSRSRSSGPPSCHLSLCCLLFNVCFGLNSDPRSCPLRTSECDLTWKEGLAAVIQVRIKMRTWMKVGLSESVLMTEKNGDSGKRPLEDRFGAREP